MEDLYMDDKTLPDRQEFKVVGREDIPNVLAYSLATGAAEFPRDFTHPDVLFAKVLRSNHGACRVTIKDTSKAEALPGVKAVITWDDPEIQAIPPYGSYVGFPPLTTTAALSDVAEMEGQEIGVAVAAESEELCDEALKLIDVDWETLPCETDVAAAAQPDAPVLQRDVSPKSNVFHEDKIEEGDVEAGFAEADHITEYTIATPSSTAYCPEPITITANWVQMPGTTEGKTLMYWANDQIQLVSQSVFSAGLGMTFDKIINNSMIQGGSFGTRGIGRRIWFLAAILSKRTGRPVRMENSRQDEFVDLQQAWGRGRIKIGYKKDGTLTAVEGNFLASCGARGSFPMGMTMWPFINTKCRNIRSSTKQVFTSTPKQAASRGVGQGLVPVATTMSRIAGELGMDETEVYLKNWGSEPSLRMCIEKGKEMFKWDEKWHPPGTKKLPNGKMHGMCVIGRPSHGHGGFVNKIDLKIKNDGKVYMPISSPAIGTHCAEACAMVVAEELGARPEDIVVQYSPYATGEIGQGASDGGATATWVARRAAIRLKNNLLNFLSKEIGFTPEELDIKDSLVYLKAHPEKNFKFNAFNTWTHYIEAGSYEGKCSFWESGTTMNAMFCEVEVDIETGKLEITNWTTVADAGKVIRPQSFLGQVDGNIYWNTSSGLCEEAVYDKATGVQLNANSIDYKIPILADMPPIDKHIIETRLAHGCYGATGIGEEQWDQSILIGAVHNAIGKWIESQPITPDKILKALGKG